jgi:hypothetical protein
MQPSRVGWRALRDSKANEQTGAADAGRAYLLLPEEVAEPDQILAAVKLLLQRG